MRKIALIGSYCDTEEKIQILKENIKKLKDLGLDILVISPLTLPSEIIESSDFVFFTKENPLLTWPVRDFTFWKTIYTPDGVVRIHRNVADYGWAGLYQIKKLSQIGLSYNYDIFYHLIYDLDIDEQIVSEITSNKTNLIHPRVNPNNPNDLWEATLHFMIFDRVKMVAVENMIDLQTYLDSNGVAEGQALKWARELNIEISEYPVKDKIYYWGKVDMFDYSKTQTYKLFISKNEVADIWRGNPPKSEKLNSSLRLLFYDSKNEFSLRVELNSKSEFFHIVTNKLIEFNIDSNQVENLKIEVNNEIIDYSDTLKRISRNIVYFE
jgi:hypothetical protein